jgi:multicomponent Na+:H+ antiporter subunit A
MPLVWTLVTLAVAVAVTPVTCARLGRLAGWPLAGLYLGAVATLWPAVSDALGGRPTEWRTAWVPALGVDVALRADGLSVVFALIALVIGALVFAYSTSYLGAGRQTSFYLVMTTFTLAMVALVLADDLVLLFVCWELTSIASFLLIARSGHAGQQASMRTLLITFVGGVALLVAVALIGVRTGTTSLSVALASPVWTEDPTYAGAVAALVALAGFTKSAQFPFHVWLPDAMAAITPVSAYLHAAAVVKAGIFVLLRFTPAFHDVWVWNASLIAAGLITALLGGRFALGQTDLKKLMAYSTVSQLGLMVATIGVGTSAAVAAAILHTIAHALFKSGLFMMVGVIDHATGTRDLRRLPPLWRAMPVTFAVAVVGCASMAGIPPTLGFVSKEALFTGLLRGEVLRAVGPLALAAAALASVLTFAYCGRIALGGFVDGRGDRPVHRPEAGLVIPAALPILAGVPLGLGVGWLDGVVGAGAEAALPGADHVHLALWHGPTPELLTTLTVFALGTAMVLRRRRLNRGLERPAFGWDGVTVIDAVTARLTRLGELVVRPLAVDYPSRHVATLLGAFVTVVLGGVLTIALLARGADAPTSVIPAAPARLTQPIDVALGLLIGIAVLGVCRSSDRLAAVVSVSAVGVLATVQMLALGAPDVTLTQLLVESLTVVMMMLVLQKLPRRFGRRPVARNRWVVALAGGVGLAAGLATYVFNGRRELSDVATYYQTETADVSGGVNIVNVILVEFRALDTMGELAVLGMAGVVLVAVLSTVRHQHLDPAADYPTDRDEPGPLLRPEGSTAHRAITHAWSNVVGLQLMVRVVVPLLALLALLIFIRGHNAPGGGFIAALVGAAAVGLSYLSTSKDRQIGPPRLPLRLIGAGILVAIATGAWGLAVAGGFLEPLHAEPFGVHLTSSMLFDVGVYGAVLGLVMTAFNLLGTSAASVALTGGESTRERVDEAVLGELPGPLDTVRGDTVQPHSPGAAADPPRPTSGSRVGVRTDHLATGTAPEEVGR